MKPLLFQTQSILLICIALCSCNSNDDPSSNKEITKEKVVLDSTEYYSDFIGGEKDGVQKFDINLLKQQTIEGKKGTIITLPAGCFGKNNIKVSVELIECYSIQSILINKLSTHTLDRKLLESDGMIYLNAYSESGDTLLIERGKIKVQMPTKNYRKDIKLFEGVMDENNNVFWSLSSVGIHKNDQRSITNESNEKTIEENLPCCDDSFIQAESPKSSLEVDKQINNENLVNYIFNISKMGWINCDRYIEGETKPLIVNVPKEYAAASYYLVLKNYNSSVPPKRTNDGKLSFMVPVNEPYTIVALSSKGEDIYFNMMDYTGGKSEVNFSELKPVTRLVLLDKLLEKFGKDIWSRPLA